MTFYIHGLGTALPPLRARQQDTADIAESLCCDNDTQSRVLQTLYRRTGVQYRHSVLIEPAVEPAMELVAASATGNDAYAKSNGQSNGKSHAQSNGKSHAKSNGQSIDHIGYIMDGGNRDNELLPCSSNQTFFTAPAHDGDLGPTTTQRMLRYEEHAATLAQAAVEQAIKTSGWQPDEITHLITISCTGFAAPGVDLSLIRNCHLNPSVTRTHVGFMGCHAAINGLRVAHAYAQADRRNRVLMCAVELCSLHQQYGWHPDHIVSNALFADGSAAVVGSQEDLTQSTGGESPNFAPFAVRDTRSFVVPDTEHMMSWHIRDHGFEMTLSAEVPSVINTLLRPWMTQWLAEHNLTIDQVQGWAIHPGGPRILEATQHSLELSDEQMGMPNSVLAQFGNMSSPTVLFIVQRLRQQNVALPYVLLAFGPGLTIEAALIA